ncbi:MAG: GAF domain-containing protein [Anaerolineae bacterium]|nr:GAF domain-containing protein [Anaerolineae bacterium]
MSTEASRQRILVVEDEVLVSYSLQRLLEILGYAVVATVTTGEDAVVEADQLRPDLILMDIRLAGPMNGIMAAAQIRERLDIPVIYLTGYSDEDTLQRAKLTAPSGYLLKPIEGGELHRTIEMALYNHVLERRLRESEARYRTLFEGVPVGLFRTHLDGTIITANPALASMLGYADMDRFMQTNALDYYVDLGEREALFAKLELQDSASGVEMQWRRGDGQLIWVRETVHAVRDSEGQLLYCEGSVEDITLYKQSEAELYDYRVHLEDLVDVRTSELLKVNRKLQVEISEREQIEAALRRHADEQAALYAVTAAAANSLEPTALLDAALDAVLPVVHADVGWVLLPPPTLEEAPRLIASRGLSEVFAQAETSLPLLMCPVCVPLFEGRSTMVETGILKDCPRIPADVLRNSGIHHHVGVPLRVGQRVLGVMNIGWRDADTAHELEHELLLAIGQQVGLALRNAQLYQAARQVDRLETVNAIGAAVVSSLELDVVLKQILQLTCYALDAAEGSILLRDEQTGDLVFSAVLAETSRMLLGQRLASGQGIAGWVAEQRCPALVEDVATDSRWLPSLDVLTEFKTHSLVCVPLIIHDAVVGVLEILNKIEGIFTADDLSLLEAVATVAAVALDNARLFAAMRDHAQELATLNEMELSLTTSLDPAVVIDSALAHVQDLFHADSVALFQRDPVSAALQMGRILMDGELEDIPLPLAPGGLADWAFSQAQPVLVADVQQDETLLKFVDGHLPHQICSLMVAPLATPAYSVGVVLVATGKTGIYLPGHLQTLRALAATLAVALDNARLYDDLRTSLREQQKAQEQLIHAEKMAALGRLAASIAHEINNPLQAVLGCLRLSQEELAGQSRREKLERHLDIAVAEVKRVSEIVHRMHDFYRHARTEMCPTDVHKIMDSVLLLSNKQLQHSSVSVECVYGENVPTIEANPDHLKQVFLNLVLNAVDAMPNGGTLRIETRMDAPDKIQIAVADAGVGMSTEVLSHLFEPFFTTKEHGSGLGLSISYGIIEAHNGEISVESQVGVGTTFVIHLPVRQI